MEDEVVTSAVINGAASSPGVTNEALVVSVNDRSEKGGIVNDIESTVINESKVNVSTVVESELLDHGNDLQSNVTENGKVNVVRNNVSNSLQNGVIENERIPSDHNDAVVDNDFDVSDEAKGITKCRVHILVLSFRLSGRCFAWYSFFLWLGSPVPAQVCPA